MRLNVINRFQGMQLLTDNLEWFHFLTAAREPEANPVAPQ